MSEALMALLPKLRRALAEPAQVLLMRKELAAAMQQVTKPPPQWSAAAEAVANASDASALAVAAARAMRLVMQAMSEQEAQQAEAQAPATRHAKPQERRTRGLEKAQSAAMDAAKKLELPVLERPVESLTGVGPALGLCLRARGLSCVADLIWFLPLGYRDERVVTPIDQLAQGQHAVTSGVIMQARSGFRGRMAEVVLASEAGQGSLRLSWFRAPSGMMARYRQGVRLRVSGMVETFRGQLTISHPRVHMLRPNEVAKGDGVVPRYSEVPGMAPKALRKAILAALKLGVREVPEAVPRHVLGEHELPSLGEALTFFHSPPQDISDAELLALNSQETPAHRRMAFEEFFLLELSLHLRKREEQGVVAESLNPPQAPLQRARDALGFELTNAQQRVVAEIAADLCATRPMRRLLQGDVGAGKTAVAMLCAAHVVAAGAQVAFMAPTEVLAAQHFRSLTPVMDALALRAELLLGGVRASHRRKVLSGLAEGTIDVVIGTHALLSEGVDFARLRLVIVDEQHRFGVSQRLRLVDKGAGVAPHLLVMTATPIPRSLTLALHGDLACSVLDEKPAGRVAPVTRAYAMAEREKALHQLRRALDSGGQAFVVCPAIEEAEDQPLRTVEEAYRDLSKRYADVGVELLHGKLSPAERTRAMDRFIAGEAKILVATTVIEVGVDIAAANVMLIEHAERFGLAQLHQLRGRVGRAGQRSACLLVHEARSEEARQRIAVLCESDDGFRIAEEDLRLRGPGELFGRKQSGLPGFRFGDLRRDGSLLAHARDAAAAIVELDPELRLPEHAAARASLDAAFALGGGLVKEEAG